MLYLLGKYTTNVMSDVLPLLALAPHAILIHPDNPVCTTEALQIKGKKHSICMLIPQGNVIASEFGELPR